MSSHINYFALLTDEKLDENYSIIDENIYLGNKSFANNYQLIKSIGITLIIGVYPKDINNSFMRPPDSRFYNIPVKDTIYEDLISHFDYCYQLMTEELDTNDGKVLVFCGAGLSRSVTIVCAFLMRKYRISASDAVGRVRDIRNRVRPNEGFMAQLCLYEEMGFQLDVNHREYRLFLLILLKKKIWSENYWKDTQIAEFCRDLCQPFITYLDKLNVNTNDCHNRSQNYYKCRHCGHQLFQEINVLYDTFAEQTDTQTQCQFLFIEALKWMLPLISLQRSGDIQCPECETVLGRFKWKSFKCECSNHIGINDSKVFKINKSAVIGFF